jgi:flagellar FliL protein
VAAESASTKQNEKSGAEGETAAGEATGKPRANPLAGIIGILGNKVTFIVSLVVIEVIVAYFVVTALIEPRLAGEPVVKNEEKKKKEDHAPLSVVSLEDIVVNLNGSEGSRYLAAGVAMELDPGKEKLTEHDLKEKTPKLKHAVISVLSTKSVAEVANAEGRELIRKEIQEHAEGAIEPLKVHAVYFTEFVIQ